MKSMKFIPWRKSVFIIFYFICSMVLIIYLMKPKSIQFSPSNFTSDSDFKQRAVDNAKAMLGTPYDPLMGKFFNVLGRLGYVVCIDVPVRAYLKAGVPITDLLKKSAEEHPEWFEITKNNEPNSQYFFRRVRNYYFLFQKNPLLEASKYPRLGDWAFYGENHIALVSSVESSGVYKVVEGNPAHEKVIISDEKYMNRTWGPASFFGRIKDFKDIYALSIN